MTRVQARPILVNLALAVAYLALGYGTLALGQTSGVEPARLVWVGSGVALSVALLVPFPVWPGVVVGGAGITLLTGDPLLHVVLTGLANGLEIGLPAWILRRVGFDRALERVWDVLLLVFVAAGLAALLAAVISVSSLVLSGLSPASSFGPIWLRWWATHGVGMLLIAPPVLSLWATRPRSPAFLKELAGVLVALALTGGLTFLAPPGSIVARIFFLSFPFLVWCAVRLGVVGAALGSSLVTALALWGAEAGRGPLVGGTDSETLLLTWSFSNGIILTTLLAGALLAGAQRARRELQTGKRRLELVLTTTDEAILVSGPDGEVIEANPGFRTLVEADDDLVGSPAREALNRVAGRLAPGEPIPEWLRVVSPERGAAEGFLFMANGTGYQAHTAPIRSEELPGRIWSFHDITDRIRAEEERERLQKQVLHAQKLEGLGLLAGGVAHDFNNLLGVILGHADLLLQEGLDESAREDAQIIIDTSMEAANLCRQMLSYAGKGTLDRGPVELSTCARELRRLLEASTFPSAELTLDLPEMPVTIEADEVQLRQVLMNLVTNAADAVAPLGEEGRVILRTRVASVDEAWLARAVVDDDLVPGEYAVVEVEDNGIGMDEHTRTQIFDPFYSSKGPGRGLGLAATLGIVRSHGGALRLDTEPGRGSHFRIALPLLGTQQPAGAR